MGAVMIILMPPRLLFLVEAAVVLGIILMDKTKEKNGKTE